MEKEKRRQLREQYANRHPEMGVVCWQHGTDRWFAVSRDTRADYNGTSFQLKLGSWPNRELQEAYRRDPDGFHWSVVRVLEYDEPSDVTDDDLSLLLLDAMEAFPTAKAMRPQRKIR